MPGSEVNGPVHQENDLMSICKWIYIDRESMPGPRSLISFVLHMTEFFVSGSCQHGDGATEEVRPGYRSIKTDI